MIRKGSKNTIIVKVWSPWDKDIHLNDYNRRTFNIKRDLTKGTYEHDDTLIARDVNPVGIYRSVAVEFYNSVRFEGAPFMRYVLSDNLTAAAITVNAGISACYISDLSFEPDDSRKYRIFLIVTDTAGNTIASNTYEDPFHHPIHVKGHPWRMNHEYGVRVYQS